MLPTVTATVAPLSGTNQDASAPNMPTAVTLAVPKPNRRPDLPVAD
jgi:hypothetical protein